MISKEKSISVILFVALAAIYLVCIATHPLLEPDEGRYAEIPREMVESGDYITPRLNYVDYFEKPALLYWMNAASFKLFGETEFAARLFNVLSALAGIVATGLLGAFIYGRAAGLLAAAVTGTSLLYFAIGTINLTDMPLALFITLSLASYYVGYKSRSRRWYAVFYAAMALGLLTKGLVAVVLPCGVVFCFALFMRKLRPITDILYLPGILLFLAISAPWFYLVCRENPDFFRFFFIQEHFMRYTTRIHDRYEPFWFFLPIMFAGMMPWSGFLLTLPGKNGILRSPGSPAVREANIFLMLWFGVILLFFSASSSKLIPYVVPCIPPLALLVAANFERFFAAAWAGSKKSGGAGFVASALLNCLFSAALFYYAFSGSGASGRELERSTAVAIASAISLPLVAGAALSLLYFFKRKNARKAAAALSASALMFLVGAQALYIPISASKSIADVAAAVIEHKNSDERIAVYGEVLQAMPFYAKERVILIDYLGELEYGASRLDEAERSSWFPKSDEFLKAWESGEPLVLVVKKKRMAGLFEGKPAGVYRELDCGGYSVFFNGPRERGF